MWLWWTWRDSTMPMPQAMRVRFGLQRSRLDVRLLARSRRKICVSACFCFCHRAQSLQCLLKRSFASSTFAETASFRSLPAPSDPSPWLRSPMSPYGFLVHGFACVLGHVFGLVMRPFSLSFKDALVSFSFSTMLMVASLAPWSIVTMNRNDPWTALQPDSPIERADAPWVTAE